MLKEEVYSPELSNLVVVRYIWANNANGNLNNAAALPASSFRTDVWAGIAQEKK